MLLHDPLGHQLVHVHVLAGEGGVVVALVDLQRVRGQQDGDVGGAVEGRREDITADLEKKLRYP